MPSRRPGLGKTRRDLMAIMGMTGAAAVAGCIGDDEEPVDDADDTDDTDDTEPTDDRQVIGTYQYALSSDGGSTIPHLIVDTTAGAYVLLTLDGTYAVTSDHQVFPLWCDIGLAEGAERVYEVEFRDNLFWSDPWGQLDAEEFVWYIENIHKADWAASLDQSDWIDTEVERTGTYTAEITLPEVRASWELEPIMWSMEMIPKDLVEDYVDDQDLEGLRTDSRLIEMEYTGNLGPYELVEWERDSAWRTVRNDDYYLRDLDADDFPDYVSEEEIETWQGAPYYEAYEYIVLPEESTRMSALQTGEIDGAAIPSERVAEFQQAVDNVYVNLAPTPYLEVMPYNQCRDGWEAWTDPDPDYDGDAVPADYGNPDANQIRQAFSHAIDKEFVANEIMGGLADPAQTFQPEWSQYFLDDDVVEFGVGDTYGLDLAQDKLETYLPDGYGYDEGELIAPEGHDRWDGDQVELHWVYVAGTQTGADISEYAMNQLDELGIDLDLTAVPFGTLLGQYYSQEPLVAEPQWGPFQYNAGHPFEAQHLEQWDMNWGVGFNTYPRTPAATEVFWVPHGTVNTYGYNPRPDLGPDNDMTMSEAFSVASQEVDDEARRQLFGEIFAKLSEDQPVNYLIMGVDEVGYNNRVVGPTEEFGYSWDYHNFYFDTNLL